jgi:hypothetical protein
LPEPNVLKSKLLKEINAVTINCIIITLNNKPAASNKQQTTGELRTVYIIFYSITTLDAKKVIFQLFLLSK